MHTPPACRAHALLTWSARRCNSHHTGTAPRTAPGRRGGAHRRRGGVRGALPHQACQIGCGTAARARHEHGGGWLDALAPRPEARQQPVDHPLALQALLRADAQGRARAQRGGARPHPNRDPNPKPSQAPPLPQDPALSPTLSPTLSPHQALPADALCALLKCVPSQAGLEL